MNKLIERILKLKDLLGNEYAIIRSDHEPMSSSENRMLRKLCDDIDSELRRHLTPAAPDDEDRCECQDHQDGPNRRR